MPEQNFPDYLLDKWSKYIRIRDKFLCYMCVEPNIPRRLLQAHHIDKKHDFPDLAIDLDNGITLCQKCHLAIVHSTETNHHKYRVMFKRWVCRKDNKKFKELYQKKLSAKPSSG